VIILISTSWVVGFQAWATMPVPPNINRITIRGYLYIYMGWSFNAKHQILGNCNIEAPSDTHSQREHVGACLLGTSTVILWFGWKIDHSWSLFISAALTFVLYNDQWENVGQEMLTTKCLLPNLFPPSPLSRIHPKE
jgi:hypothetical protein